MMARTMADNLKPRDAEEVEQAVHWALGNGKTLEVVGRGSKRAIGRAAQWDATLDLSALSGVTLYEPEELVLSAKAGTPIAEIEALVAASNQQLAFEPMDYAVAAGRSGRRRHHRRRRSRLTFPGRAASRPARRAIIFLASARCPAAARPSNPAAASSRTSPATTCASSLPAPGARSPP